MHISTSKLLLNGAWLFQPDWNSPNIKTLPKKLLSPDEWLPAVVPGSVHTDLMKAGKIPDPFVNENENIVQWIAEIGWKYRREFEMDREILSAPIIELCAEGLDTFAQIYINGKHVGETNNMFIPNQFDVKSLLHEGKNNIEIIFDSPIDQVRKLEKKHGKLNVALDSFRVYARKAQYSFGWDWGPKLATSGIWRHIYLAYGNILLHNLKINSDLDASLKEATVQVEAEVSCVAVKSIEWKITIEGPDYCSTVEIRSAAGKQDFQFKIENPKLWWPNGFGEQFLYNVKFRISIEGKVQIKIDKKIGLRRVELEREPENGGESFRFRINNVKVFCKGANWIPADSFLPRITKDKYRTLLTLARDANINMLRVWGGGIYEQPIFYDLCDEFGLMVWQDFMFACGSYPEYEHFVANVKQEVRVIYRQLHFHPSIVLWCGNNENEWIWRQESGRPVGEMPGEKLFSEVIPNILFSERSSNPYWQSSPFGGEDPNSESIGNQHKWNMWSGWDSPTVVKDDRSRFVTEFGFQSPACLPTWQENIDAEFQNPQHRVMQHHNKQIKGSERLHHYIAEQLTVPDNFDEFIYYGQVMQAEALKYCIEHWRRQKFLTSGVLFWQLNDCWPVTSWSIIDSELRPKAAYWYTRRFFSPLILAHKENGKYLEFYAVNDKKDASAYELEVCKFDFYGESSVIYQSKTLIPANNSIPLVSFQQTNLNITDPSQQYIRARLIDGDKTLAVNRYFFKPIKNLCLGVPKLKTNLLTKSCGQWQLNITSDCFVKAICIKLANEQFQLSDNFFDLDAGEVRSLDIYSPDQTANLLISDISFQWIG